MEFGDFPFSELVFPFLYDEKMKSFFPLMSALMSKTKKGAPVHFGNSSLKMEKALKTQGFSLNAEDGT